MHQVLISNLFLSITFTKKDATLTNLYYDPDQEKSNDIYTDVAKYVTIDCQKYMKMDVDAELEKYKQETSDEDEIKKMKKLLSLKKVLIFG